MMISFLLALRIAIIGLFHYASDTSISRNTIVLWIGGCIFTFGALLYCTISSNEESVPDINAVELLKVERIFLQGMIIKLMRAMVRTILILIPLM